MDSRLIKVRACEKNKKKIKTINKIMNYKLYQTIAIASFALVSSCSSSEITETNKEVSENVEALENNENAVPESINEISEDVDATKFKELLELTAYNLVDVRTPEEYNEGSISGAVNIDFNGQNFETEIGNLDRTTPVLVFCQSGGRSGKAKTKMEALGFKEIYNLVGGYGSWPYK